MLNKTLATKAIFKKADIESSSDFIVAAHHLCKEFDYGMMLRIDPVYRWEYANWHDSWESNVNFISSKLPDLDPDDYNDVYDSYTDILKYFLEDSTVSTIYKMDENDHIGWKIFKELNEKRNLCFKFLAISIRNTQ